MATDPAPSTDGDESLEEIQVKLPASVMAFLRDEAKKRHISTGDMLRMALGTQKFLAEAVDSGAKVQIKGKVGTKDVAI